VLGIFVVGMAGWTMAWQTGMWEPAPIENSGDSDEATGGLVLGYFSALCYLGYVWLCEIDGDWVDVDFLQSEIASDLQKL
jgi:hypothetical protein